VGLKCKHLLPHVGVTRSLPNGNYSSSFCGMSRRAPELAHYPGCSCAFADDDSHQNAFQGKLFSTVPHRHYVHGILRYCPVVKDLTCNDSDDGSKLVGALVAAKCNNLRMLRGISPNAAQAKRLVKTTLNLGSIYVHAGEWSS